MKIIAVTNQKGGVGKTTLSFNLAKVLGSLNYSVLAIDNDPQGNLTTALLDDDTELTADVLNMYQGETVTPQKITENVHLIGANIHLAKIAEQDFDVIFSLKEQLEALEGITEYDFVIIDCLPAFGYLNMAALNAANFVLIPTKPTPFAIAGLTDLLDIIHKTKKRLNQGLKVLGIVLNLVDNTVINREFENLLREEGDIHVFETVLAKSVKFEESPTLHESILEYGPGSKSAVQFNGVVDEFLSTIKLAETKI